MADYSARVQKL